MRISLNRSVWYSKWNMSCGNWTHATLIKNTKLSICHSPKREKEKRGGREREREWETKGLHMFYYCWQKMTNIVSRYKERFVTPIWNNNKAPYRFWLLTYKWGYHFPDKMCYVLYIGFVISDHFIYPLNSGAIQPFPFRDNPPFLLSLSSIKDLYLDHSY